MHLTDDTLDRRAELARLIDLVRLGLGLTPTTSPQRLDLTTVQRASAAGVREVVARCADIVGADDDARQWLGRHTEADVKRSMKNRVMAMAVVDRLEAAGVRSLVFKGTALGVLSGREPRDRPGSDIDLLIEPENLPIAHRVLREWSFEPAFGFPEPGTSQRDRYARWLWCELDYSRHDVSVDVHWRLVPPHISGFESSRLLDRSVVVDAGGVSLRTLCADDALAHVALHGSKDNWRSLRSLVDAWYLLTNAGATWRGARAAVGRSAALDVCEAAVAHLVSGEHLPHPRAASRPLRTWMAGATSNRPAAAVDDSLSGFVRNAMRRFALKRSLSTFAMIVCQLVLPPSTLAQSTLRGPWWPLAFFSQPRLLVVKALRSRRNAGTRVAG